MSEARKNVNLGLLLQKLKKEASTTQQPISPGFSNESRIPSEDKKDYKDKIIELQSQEILKLETQIADMSRKLEESKNEKLRVFKMFEREREECIESNTKLTVNEADLTEAISTLDGALESITEKKKEIKSLKTKLNALNMESEMKNEFINSALKKIQMMDYAQKYFMCFLENQGSQIGMLMEEKCNISSPKETSKRKNKKEELEEKIRLLEAENEVWKAMNSVRNLKNSSSSQDEASCSSGKMEVDKSDEKEIPTQDLPSASSPLPYKCEVCQKTFDDLGPLKHHMRIDHRMAGVLDSFVCGCKSCGLMFRTEEQFKQHNCEETLVNYLFKTMKSFVNEPSNVDVNLY